MRFHFNPHYCICKNIACNQNLVFMFSSVNLTFFLCIVVCTMCMMHLHFGSGECLYARHGCLVLKFCGGQGFDGVQLN